VTIYELAKLIDVQLVVSWPNGADLFSARLQGVEVKDSTDSSIAASAVAFGADPSTAITALCERISGKLLVKDGLSPSNRIELKLPDLYNDRP
jgi:hypothetical protein